MFAHRLYPYKIGILTLFCYGILLCACRSSSTHSDDDSLNYVHFEGSRSSMSLISQGSATRIYIDSLEFPGVVKVMKWFLDDIEKVTGIRPELSYTEERVDDYAVIVGTLGKNRWIDRMVGEGILETGDLEGKWETTLIQVIQNPQPNIKKALVIVGSDKRGTIYGMLDISRKMGVSPWYWWADVPVWEHPEIYIRSGRHILAGPKVKYRGIFLNDEEPALGRWAVENYGGFTHEFYEKIFELLLRLKGNYLWPAMWWASFNTDDTLNPFLADELGIVMGTTHHEPMMRAHAEWRNTNGGDWNYTTNKKQLDLFWHEGIERMGPFESIVSIGMRGDGDLAMTEETNIALLEEIVGEQRNIITEVTGKPAAQTPQLWALYKEVQDYYDKGMRVPEDVTLLLCDDNWGNIRRLPELDAEPRRGGYGIYYHFDYVGGPRNYKWINTNNLPRIWEQLNLAYHYGVDRIWLVNVGDLKPMELPMSFFLDLAWDPGQWTPERLEKYTLSWAEEQFGVGYAEAITEILRQYTQFNCRRKPELLDQNTYSVTNYREFERVVGEYTELEHKAREIYDLIDTNQRDAYYQLVYHPVLASANLNELYFTIAMNRLYAKQGRSVTNALAERARELFRKDAEITEYYHTKLSNGKWNHMMAQTHIGYTYWQQPDKNHMPAVKQIDVPTGAEMRISVEGDSSWWPGAGSAPILPRFDSFNKQSYFIEVFNAGDVPFHFQTELSDTWIDLSLREGKVDRQIRIFVNLDWESMKSGNHNAHIRFVPEFGDPVSVFLTANKYEDTVLKEALGAIENNGVVSMEAHHFSRSTTNEGVRWVVIPDLGRTHSAVTTLPPTISISNPGQTSPVLEYDFFLLDEPDSGMVEVGIYISPTLDFHNDDLFCAISIDEERPEEVRIHRDKSLSAWEKAVSNNILYITTRHPVSTKGRHTLRYWLMSGGVVIQKIIINNGGLETSYLGPPESIIKK